MHDNKTDSPGQEHRLSRPGLSILYCAFVLCRSHAPFMHTTGTGHLTLLHSDLLAVNDVQTRGKAIYGAPDILAGERVHAAAACGDRFRG